MHVCVLEVSVRLWLLGIIVFRNVHLLTMCLSLESVNRFFEPLLNRRPGILGVTSSSGFGDLTRTSALVRHFHDNNSIKTHCDNEGLAGRKGVRKHTFTRVARENVHLN